MMSMPYYYFKAMDENTNDWYYFELHELAEDYTLEFDALKPSDRRTIKKKTICQWSGMDDKNKKKIFAGDIFINGDGRGTVEFHNGCFVLSYLTNESSPREVKRFLHNWHDGIEIVGNIHG